jgi:putative ABC transport system permease protein
VVLSDRLWRRSFGADPGIVGRDIRLDDQNFRVTGVMPATFDFPLATELWTPMALIPAERSSRTTHSQEAVARLKPGFTLEQASSELAGIGARLETGYPETNKGGRFAVWNVRRYLVDYETAQYSIMLLVSVMFVLLIACVNVANLQFARATGRLREVAVRTALGASRWRVMMQLMTESVLIGLVGGALGLVVGVWGMGLAKGGMPAEIERYVLGWKDIHLDTRVLLFTLAAAVGSGILAGLAPAWQCSRPNLTDALKEGGRGGSSGAGRHRLRNTLVAAEVALAVVLLTGAGLMVRGFRALVDHGRRTDPATLLTLRLGLTESRYPEPLQRTAYFDRVLAAIRGVAGVRSAAAASGIPYAGFSLNRNFEIEGQMSDPEHRPNGMYQVATPSYFGTLRVPLIAGRLLEDRDSADSSKVALVSQSMARRWWKNGSPLGRHIRIDTGDAKGPALTIVGVTGDVVHNPYDREPRRTIYVPLAQAPRLSMQIAIRTAGDALAVAPAVQAAIRQVDSQVPIVEMLTMERLIHNRAIGLDYMAVLMGIFGALALVLSGVGVYGVMAYTVSEQTRDIGLRMALGAARENVLAMIFRRGLITVGAGLIVGLPLAFAFAQLLASLIYGVTANDPATFVAIPVALLGAAALAIYVPARRAMRIDPIVALRYE